MRFKCFSIAEIAKENKKMTDIRHDTLFISGHSLFESDSECLPRKRATQTHLLGVYTDRKDAIFKYAMAFFDEAFLVAKRADDSAVAGNARVDCQHKLLYHKNPPHS